MNCFRIMAITAGIFVPVVLYAQTPFQNLDFEQATIIPIVGSPYYPYQVETADALLGWTTYQAGNIVTSIGYNTLAVGAALVSIHDTSDTYSSMYGGVIDGNFTVLLQPSFPGAGMSAAIGQTDVVPVNAQSVRFYANGPISVSFAGLPISLSVLGMGSNYTIYGGNISAFAGQSGELRFTANAISPSGWGTALDDISFSRLPVPEPSVVGLLTLGSLLLGWRWRQQRK